MKLRKRFVLTSKEDVKKNARMRRALTLTVLFSSIIVPLINDGVIYTLAELTDQDIAILWLNAMLRYTMIILWYLCTFVSFAAVITGIFHFGFKAFKAPPLIMIAGSIVKYLIAQYGSYVFCYEHYIINNEATEVAAAVFNYLFLAVFDMIKNVVFIVICCRYAKKANKEDLPDSSDKPENIRIGELLKTSLKKPNPFFGFCVFAAGFEAACGIISRFFSVTLFELIAGGAPETGLDYAALFNGYLPIIPFCVAGFFVCTALCVRFSYMKPAKRK